MARSRDTHGMTPGWLRVMRYRMPIHYRRITKKQRESADINQKDFHEAHLSAYCGGNFLTERMRG
jgi:hypothetical protein